MNKVDSVEIDLRVRGCHDSLNRKVQASEVTARIRRKSGEDLHSTRVVSPDLSPNYGNGEDHPVYSVGRHSATTLSLF